MTGFRIGYLAGPSNFIDAVARLKSVLSGPCLLYSQYAALAAFTGRCRVMMEGLDSLDIP